MGELRNRPNFKTIDVLPTPEFLNEQQRIHLASELSAIRDVNLESLPLMFQYVKGFVLIVQE